MVKIKSYKNGEEYSIYHVDNGPDLLLKITKFLEIYGEDPEYLFFTENEDGETIQIKDAGHYDGSAHAFEYKDCKVFLFFGTYKTYITLVYDKKNREKIINDFIKIFNPELK